MRRDFSPLFFAAVVSLPLVSSACVSSGTYDELLLEHERTKRELVDAQMRRDLATQKQQAAEEALSSEKRARQTEGAAAAQQLLSEQQALGARVKAAEEALERARGELKSTSDELATTVKDKAGLRESVEQMKTALDELNKRKAEADRRVAEYKALLGRFQALIDAGKLNVKIVDGRMVVALASDILFASGSSALSKEGRAAVEEVAGVLASIPDRRFQVEGHTDNVPIKTPQFPSNWELAAARALTVVKTMVDAGLPKDRVSAASYGDVKPAGDNATPEGKAQNRRIEIVVVPDLSTLPGFDELKKVR
jgi:chemotaxis protein MotB